MRLLKAYAIFLIPLFLFGCNTNKKNEENKIITRDLVFESFTYDLVGKNSNIDTTLYPGMTSEYLRFIGQGVLPKDIGDTDIRHLRDSLLRISNLTIDKSGATIPMLADGVALSDLPSGEVDLNGEVNTSLSTTLVTPRVVVWKNNTYSYSAGNAHGNTSTTYINFCMNDGQILKIYNLFSPGYQLKLRKMIRDKILEKKLELYIPISEVEIPSQFAITSQGVIFSYDPYEIAPYSAGTVEVELSLDELNDILSPKGKYLLTGVIPEES